jgi:hypothetical protein
MTGTNQEIANTRRSDLQCGSATARGPSKCDLHQSPFTCGAGEWVTFGLGHRPSRGGRPVGCMAQPLAFAVVLVVLAVSLDGLRVGLAASNTFRLSCFLAMRTPDLGWRQP